MNGEFETVTENGDLSERDLRSIKFHPENNKGSITLMPRKDGNWRGFMWKNDKMYQTRQATPDACLQTLLTAK